MIEIIQLKLPRKSPDESQKHHAERLKDGRWASKQVQATAFQQFGIVQAESKGEDGYDDQDGAEVEHKMVTTCTYARRSQFTGDNRICLPDDVKDCCQKDYVFSYVRGPIPFAVRVTKDEMLAWLGGGHIDPVTGKITRDALFHLIRPFDKDRLLPTPLKGETKERLERLAARRKDTRQIAARIKKYTDSYERKCMNRIADGRRQQQYYENLVTA